MSRRLRSVLPSLVALLLALAWAPDPVAAQAPADHAVLISIDGLRPDLYLDEGWPAPMLQRVAREGVHARGVRGVFPSVTHPSHTTMVTGVFPARHGLVYAGVASSVGAELIGLGAWPPWWPPSWASRPGRWTASSAPASWRRRHARSPG